MQRYEWNWPFIGLCLIGVLFVIVIIVYVIKGMTCDDSGMSQCEEKVATLEAELEVARNLTSADSRVLAMQSHLEACNVKLDKVKRDSEALIDSLDEDFQEAQLECEAEATIVVDAARRLCCPVNRYDIVNDAIRCAEDGRYVLTC